MASELPLELEPDCVERSFDVGVAPRRLQVVLERDVPDRTPAVVVGEKLPLRPLTVDLREVHRATESFDRPAESRRANGSVRLSSRRGQD